MINITTAILLGVLFGICNTQKIIYNCLSLQNVGSNVTGVYYLNQSIDCTGASFQISTFSGVIDGRGFTIFNLTMSQSGLVNTGSGMTLQNLVFQNVQYSSGSGACGLVVSCSGCTFTNVSITSTPPFSNVFKGAPVGSFIGNVVGGVNTLSNCTIQNTCVQYSAIGLYAGGTFIGMASSGATINITFCYNLGFPATPTSDIITGYRSLSTIVDTLPQIFSIAINEFDIRKGLSEGLLDAQKVQFPSQRAG